MARHNRQAIAKLAIEVLAPIVRKSGQQYPANSHVGLSWELEAFGLRIALTEQVQLSPVDALLSSLIDVWPVNGPKVFSVSWEPQRPWVPPRVVRFKPGEWLNVFTAQSLASQ